LDWERWDDKTKDEDWLDVYGQGWTKLKKLRQERNNNRDFQFDILMANPPFAGDIKESRILAKYELSKKYVTQDVIEANVRKIKSIEKGQHQKVGRDILFIERNLDFLKPGGRMAVVLPQGRFNNSSDKYLREFIAKRCRILAVVGLHGNVFKPHTGTKTSVLLVQKWDDILCPKKEDYPIFFATMQEPSKDNSGDKIYLRRKDLPQYFVVKPADPEYVQTEMVLNDPKVSYVSTIKDLDEYVLDKHDHLIVRHDLFNHDGYTQDGIAEAFAEFAKKEGLSFF
jgi:type I restriction enzyme M protein